MFRITVGRKDGTVDIITLADGKLQTVQVKKENGQTDKWLLRTVPVWRTNDELCFAMPAQAKSNRPEIVLWSKKGVRVISKNWPQKVMDEFKPQN